MNRIRTSHSAPLFLIASNASEGGQSDLVKNLDFTTESRRATLAS